MRDEFAHCKRRLGCSKNLNIPVEVIFIYLCKAFDKVSHSDLKLKPESYGFHHKIIDWIGDFLSDRREQIRVNETLYS